MASEIERKFLTVSDAWRDGVRCSERLRQGYLAGDAHCSVRVRVCDDRAWLNVKSATLGVARLEYEYAIPVADAAQMLDRLCHAGIIDKTRYHVDHAGHTWEIDVFEGDNAGLVVAEIELSAQDEAFREPPWLGAEVSHEARYYNSVLVQRPFKDWPPEGG